MKKAIRTALEPATVPAQMPFLENILLTARHTP